MRVPLLPVLCLLLAGLAADVYIYLRMRHGGTPRGWCIFHAVLATVASLGLLFVCCAPKKGAGDTGLAVLMWTLYAYLTIYIPKYIVALFMLVQQGLGALLRRRLRGIAVAGGIAGTAVFSLLWWGALVNRFNIDVRHVDVPVAGLPETFDGYRIVQISDMHTGTYGSDTSFIAKVADSIAALRPDIVFFTGDIVNRHSGELSPFTSTLSRITAPDGVWSIMGNHDYGDYYRWPSPEARLADIAALRAMQRSMGWQMLDNEHTVLRRGADSLTVIGVENIGDPPFRVYGDLSRAYPSLGDSAVKILLTHNPVHWTDSIAGRPDANVALTLSGHTHAMQMSLLGVSPAVMRYKTWGGLYTDSLGRHLYVNIGLGEVGMPARVGATPEITLITLKATH